MKTKTLTAILIAAALQLNANENPGQLAKTNTSFSTAKSAKLKPANPPMFAAGLDLGFYRNMNESRSSIPNFEGSTNKSSFFSFAPQFWYSPNEKYCIIPSFGFGFYNYTYEDQNGTTEEKESYMYPSLAFLRYCSDPCDKFQTFTGLRVGGGFGNGTYSYSGKTPAVVVNSETSYSESYFSAIAGISYDFTQKISVFGSADLLSYSRSKSIHDDKSPKDYNAYPGIDFCRDVRIGAKLNFSDKGSKTKK